MTAQRIGATEFVFMVAGVVSTTAFSMDGMLPSLPAIGAELSPEAPNDAQFVLTAFLVGLGIGTLFVGPLSDTLGRKPVMIATCGLAVLGAILSHFANSLEMLIAARVLHGFGGAGPRALVLAVVRDLYEGRQMARIMSLVMTIFVLVPAVAPLMGHYVDLAFGWRAVFLAFAIWLILTVGWLALRLAETHPPERRVRLAVPTILSGLRAIATNRVVMAAIVVLSLTFGMLVSMLVSVQQVFEITFGRAESFPWWFALTAVLSMAGALLNARLVMRLGMRLMIAAAVGAQAVLAGSLAVVTWAEVLPPALAFPAFFIWMTTVFGMMSLTIGNLNALALEPMGHAAGLAASVVSAVSTVAGAVLAMPVGLAFDGTPLPVMAGIFGFSVAALIAMRFTAGPKPGVTPSP